MADTSNFGFGFPVSAPPLEEDDEEESEQEVAGSEQGEGEQSVIKLIEREYGNGSKNFSKKRSRQQYQGNNYSNAPKNGKKKKLNFK